MEQGGWIVTFGDTASICVQSLKKYDFNWPLGYSSLDDPLDTTWGITFLRFNTPDGRMRARYDPGKTIDLTGTSAAMSDKNGLHLFAYNGYWIEEESNQIMENGNKMTATLADFKWGQAQDQCAVVLPMSNSDHNYMMIHMDCYFDFDLQTIRGHQVFYSIISYPPEGGYGKVISKRNLVLTDDLGVGKITATRHANGRDWWIPIPESGSNRYYIFLVDSHGLHLSHTQEIGPENELGVGFAEFSQDGSKYAIINWVDTNEGAILDYYDFDRCTGTFSEHRRLKFNLGSFGIGVTFSPNNRFLYVSLWRTLYQIDLLNAPQDTVVADYWDGFFDPTQLASGWEVSSAYGALHIGPDGIVYSVNTNLQSRWLNTIRYPNLPTPYCEARQHSVFTPTPSLSPPNFAYYRLGPVDGSVCDSLGINNIPWCWWRYEQDSSVYGTVHFTDASAHTPMHWHWDFGDGNTSLDTSPVHHYNKPGIYQACLIVSNANGADTLCRTINIATVSEGQPVPKEAEIEVFPNPFREGFTLQVSGYLPRQGVCRIFDVVGQEVAAQRVMQGWNTFLLPHLPAGVYSYTMTDGDFVVKTGKVVKVE